MLNDSYLLGKFRLPWKLSTKYKRALKAGGLNSSCDGNLSRLAPGNLIRFSRYRKNFSPFQVFYLPYQAKYFLSFQQTFRAATLSKGEWEGEMEGARR